MKPSHEPTIWMNVTTSSSWTRPPVGIVRVESALADALESMLGPKRFRRCIWAGQEFVAWTKTASTRKTDPIGKAVDHILPDSPAFVQARGLLDQALRSFANSADGGSGDHIDVSIPLDATATNKPRRGDFLISVGLDWDGQYTERFYELSRDRGLRIITCCYDLIPVIYPHYCVGDVADKFKNYFATLTWGSEAVLCISRNTLADYEELCARLGAPQRRTAVIPLGDQMPVATDAKVSQDVALLLEQPFILFVSTIERRKNHEVLYRAYRLLLERDPTIQLPKLVFVGMPGWGVGDLLKDIELDPVTKGAIVLLNHVTDNDLGQLYRQALFCVYPSLYEGWGLPVAEALTAGKMVLVSDRGSLPEVGGDLVRYVDPWDPRAWADEISTLVGSPELLEQCERRIRAEYQPKTWDQSANIVVDLIKDLTSIPPPTTQILYPGYDFSCQVGIHDGAALRSQGRSGYLMYGPYTSLNPGHYRWEIDYELVEHGTGQMVVELVDAAHGRLLLREDVRWHPADPVSAGRTAGFEMRIEKYLESHELRVLIDHSVVALKRVSREQIGH